MDRTINETRTTSFAVHTNALACENVDRSILEEYITLHVKSSISRAFVWVSRLYDSELPFNQELLTAVRELYSETQNPDLKAALKLPVAYMLAQNRVIEPYSTSPFGKVDNKHSRYHCKVTAPAIASAKLSYEFILFWHRAHQELLREIGWDMDGFYSWEM
ncbi:hypothetical protein G7Y89_g9077 [Cudoniella acicularis]|uniref:Uncharacterized protein n=1 Tax=Cudoniella acicularis TaxID=354080 RepID=A0A8H4RFC8_9HELO|nr:hypothetical protein G7Y89_g9077 [Cudoniella acicularis]